ncbi:MAG: LuxR C-terminal-related transcriptional regulator [Actinomycetota bacterium]|nr:LuxR C-terminal-related transcriptional regulator [Actinomycetota bacterium]
MLALVHGTTRKQAARALGVTSATVRTHAHNAYQRLGVANVTQALAVMLREGWGDYRRGSDAHETYGEGC